MEFRARHVALIAIAAGTWASDVYFRGGLVGHLTAVQIVFAENLLLALVSLLWLMPRIVYLRGLKPDAWVAAVIIGVGPQAAATLMFTASLSYGAFAETYLLQQLQPVVAILLASVVLHERRASRFWIGASVAVLGAYLLVFGADARGPFAARHSPNLIAGGLAIGAAVLWAAGTVMGRRLLAQSDYLTTAALRFALAAPVLGLALVVTRGSHALAGYHAADVPMLVGLAAVPGMLGIALYYRGLRGTPASVSTLAELAFPAAATIISVLPVPFGFAQPLAALQVLGAIALAGAVVYLARRVPDVVTVPQGIDIGHRSEAALRDMPQMTS